MLKPVKIISQLNRLVFSLDVVGEHSHDPGWSRPARKHKFYTLWLITKGKVEIVIDGQKHIGEPGMIFVFVPGMVTERRVLNTEPFEHYFIRFSFMEAFQEQGYWQTNKSEETVFPLQGGYKIQNVPNVLQKFEQLIQFWKQKGPMMLMRKNILFQELWLTIAQDFRAQKVAGDTTVLIDSTIDYMVNHYNESMELNELALLAGLSKSHYVRLFKKYTGYSPIEYLTQLRIGKAKELMMVSDYRMKQIAHAVGYNDEFYFSRIFKKHVGVSPSEYHERNGAITKE
ncbi:AraC family transcriptional regulator [Aquibacillus salsiterrae]|uniref:AraC family transcriptional regulator n=1 Tax=Aquibacillus salsiterrae TaxID=2950439 RepID=A0A9X3WDC8_9BACI|nr:AraC family transcriptional regulator [Aquibacillus salsiterrae]MDC3416010.1 AraC family transcriptional regulator [Aquibacillus salsiterrae]